MSVVTHISPVVELLQQVFVQVRGADSSDLLVSDQCLQLLPGRLKIGQTLAVPLPAARRRDDNRVELRYAQRLAGLEIPEEQRRFKNPDFVRIGCSLGGAGDRQLTHRHCISDGGLSRLTQEQLH